MLSDSGEFCVQKLDRLILPDLKDSQLHPQLPTAHRTDLSVLNASLKTETIGERQSFLVLF